MQRRSWSSIAIYFALTLLALSFIVPLYSFPALGDAGRDLVYPWEAVRSNPVLGLALLAPLLTLLILRKRTGRPWNRIVLSLVPLLLAGSAFVVYLESALSFSSLQMPFPFFPLPSLLTGSSIGIGCWAFVTANALLLIIWGAAFWKQIRLHPGKENPAIACS